MSGTASRSPLSGPQGPAGNDNWIYQGRKEHGHFGDGTRPDPLADPLADAAPRTADEPLVPKGASFAAVVRGSIAALAVRAQAGLLEQNARNLADLIYTEAGGEGEKAQIAVGATVLNRMRRNGTDRVDDVRNGYSYRTPAPADKPAPAIARGLLVNSIKDPTNFARL